jgi:xanthine dehydrogenase YagS FAD-binding subunit
MHAFILDRPRDLHDALRAGAEFIAGGTDMVQLMREGVRRPSRLTDLSGVLPTALSFGVDYVRIGAGATMEEVATSPEMRAAVPAATQALLESASPQVRNLATMGGNLLQRTRCGYFRDAGEPHCNKRNPGSGCAALGGENRILAVLGTSENCIANHPSDLAVALTALRATLLLRGPGGERTLEIDGLHRLPGDRPDLETNLQDGEAIEAIEVPVDAACRNSVYLKVRDRASFEWALLSAAVGLEIEDGCIRAARIAMGGVGTKPWRMATVEDALVGKAPDRASVAAAVRLAVDGARGWGENDFKIEMMPRVLGRAIEIAAQRVGDAA